MMSASGVVSLKKARLIRPRKSNTMPVEATILGSILSESYLKREQLWSDYG
jgi:hypothetical protein